MNKIALLASIYCSCLIFGCAGHREDKTQPILASHEDNAIESLVSISPVILYARAEDTRVVRVSNRISYQITTFQARKRFREPGEGLMAYGPIRTDPATHSEIYVITTDQLDGSEYLSPRYQNGKEYLLFLNPVSLYLYARVYQDQFEREHLWRPDFDEKLSKLLMPGQQTNPRQK